MSDDPTGSSPVRFVLLAGLGACLALLLGLLGVLVAIALFAAFAAWARDNSDSRRA